MKLKELLLSVLALSPFRQKEKLEKEFNTWKGDNEQTYDVLVMDLSLQ